MQTDSIEITSCHTYLFLIAHKFFANFQVLKIIHSVKVVQEQSVFWLFIDIKILDQTYCICWQGYKMFSNSTALQQKYNEIQIKIKDMIRLSLYSSTQLKYQFYTSILVVVYYGYTYSQF